MAKRAQAGEVTATDEELHAVTVGERKPHNAPVAMAEYDPAWPALFEREAQRIRLALGDTVVRLEHTGSTSVPGLAAKPIVVGLPPATRLDVEGQGL